MRGKFTLVLLALTMISCSKDWTRTDQNMDYSYGRGSSEVFDMAENVIFEELTKAQNRMRTIQRRMCGLPSRYPRRYGRWY